MELLNGIGLFVALIIILIIDIWSTNIAFNYNKLILNNRKFVDDLLESKKQDVYSSELNPVARGFMKKFGVLKGMIINSIVLNIPIYLILALLVIFEYVKIEYIMCLVTFHMGAIYMQAWKSYVSRRDFKKIGVKI
jgi:hypothetical protein